MRCVMLLLPIAVLPPSLALAQSPPPAETPDLVENLVTFDAGAATLRWERQHWLLVSGDRVLKDFGPSQAEARQALLVVQELKLNQYATIGAPAPVAEYWLSDGRAPEGFTPGLRRVGMDINSLRVERVQAQWCLRDARTVLFNFGFHGEDARRALAIIQKYGFTEIGVIGPTQPSMYVFLAPMIGRSPAARAMPSSHRPAGGGNADTGFAAVVTPALAPLSGSSVSRPLPGWGEQMESVPFNWRQAQINHDSGSWRLIAGDHVLGDFGDDETAAQQALSLLFYYRFTEHCAIGGSKPVFSFFLVNGRAPFGAMYGVNGQAFQADRLSVQKLGNNWSLCEGDRVLVVLGEKADEAEQLLDVIRQHKFDRLCRLGPAERGMTFLVRSR